MRSITPIVAIVVLLLMTVAAAGMAYLTLTTYQSTAQSGTQGGLETLGSIIRTQLKIESVSGGQIYLRNLGSETFTNPAFYIEGRPLNFTGPEECESGKICVFTIQENVTCEGECELSMGEDMPVGTLVSVDEEDLTSGAQYLTTFSDSSSQKTITFSTAGWNNSARLRIPTNASVINAELDSIGSGYPVTIQETLITPDDSYGAYNPSIALDSSKNSYLVYRDDRLGDWNMYWIKLNSTGANLTSEILITPDDSYLANFPSFALDSSNNSYIVYEDNRLGDANIYWVKLNSTGANLTSEILITPDDSYNAGRPLIAIDSSSNSYIVYRDNRLGDYNIYWVKLNSTGAKLTSEILITPADSYNTWGPLIALDSSNNSYVVYEDNRLGDYNIYWVKLNSTGEKITPEILITPDDSYNAETTSIALDSSNNSYIAYEDNRLGDYNIYWVKLNSTGANLTSEILITPDDSYTAWETSIALDSSSNSYVVYYDNRLGDTNIYWIKINSTGANLTSEILITPDDSSDANWPSIALDSSNNSYLVYYDNRLGDTNIYWIKINSTGQFYSYPQYPTSPTIDIGSDGDAEWSYSGEFSTSQTIPNFSAELDSFLPVCTCSGCSVDGSYCNITINVTSQSAGIVQLSNLNIAYT